MATAELGLGDFLVGSDFASAQVGTLGGAVSPTSAPVICQKRPGQGHGQAYLPFRPVLKLLFEVVGHGREQHRFVGSGVAPHGQPAQARTFSRRRL